MSNSLTTITPNQIHDILNLHARSEDATGRWVAPYFEGPPGVAKTQQVFSWFADVKNIPHVVIYPQLMTETDYRGALYFPKDADEPRLMPIGELKVMIQAKERIGVLVDELTRGMPEQLNFLMPFFHPDTNGVDILAPEIRHYIVTCGNKYDLGAYDLPSALEGRLIKYSIKPSAKEFARVLIEQGVPAEFAAFVLAQPKIIEDDLVQPRKLHYGADHWQAAKNKWERTLTLVGAVGPEVGKMLSEFLDMMTGLPDYSAIVTAPSSIPISNNPGFDFALATMLANRAKPNDAKEILTFINRLRSDAARLFAWTVSRSNEAFANTKDFGNFITNNPTFTL